MLSSNLLEAAKRAEVTALLIRAGYRVYRPEADTDGEDLVLRRPDGSLIPVQQKGRVHVEREKYSSRSIWMLFPDAPFNGVRQRHWFLVEHDLLYEWLEHQHGHAPGFADGKWSCRSPAKWLREKLEPYRLRLS
jgi:hypothetical protein